MMKYKRRALLLMAVVMVLWTACTQSDSETQTLENDPPQTTFKPVPAIRLMRGINLGNWLDAPIPGEWDVTILPEHFAVIRQAGFDTVRIPTRFSAHADSQPPYQLDEDFMRVVDAAVQDGLENGLEVILDFHYYDALMLTWGAHEDRFLAIWEQLAERYRDFPDELYFEVLNEPHWKLDTPAWNVLAGKALELIRTSNPHRWVIIGGTDYNSVYELEGLRMPQDERVIATFHFYDPFEFTHQGTSWVTGSSEWKGTRWRGTAQEQEEIIEALDIAVNWSRREGIPILMGEFGVFGEIDEVDRSAWTAFVVDQAEERGIGWIYWDFCGEFYSFDCESGEWDPMMLEALIKQ